ncbi:uncharacterized protein [Atheta coriaria]|uniref:uncharacterized protein isoform X5 n=1 Tax=Dalotia coriaria TaxID=877792 RepID=UPI0031F36A2C
MKKQVVYVVIIMVAVLTLQCAGMSLRGSDPAPGRSPGPPITTFASSTPSTMVDPPPTSTLLPVSPMADSLRSSSKEQKNCDIFRYASATNENESDAYNVTLAHELFDVGILTPKVIYQVVITRSTLTSQAISDVMVTSITQSGEPIGSFYTTDGSEESSSKCASHQYKSQFRVGDEEIVVNWTIPKPIHIHNPQTNISFVLKYRDSNAASDSNVRVVTLHVAVIQACQLWLKATERTVAWRDVPAGNDCEVVFPGGHSTGHGIVIEMIKLNTPCAKGYLHFAGTNNTQKLSSPSYRSHRQARLCGKLEELPEADRHIYFPSAHSSPLMYIHGSPIFVLSYHLVDYCYNVTFTTRNGTFELRPTASGELECTFKINLPYGNRVALTLQFGGDVTTVTTDRPLWKNNSSGCTGLLVRLQDGPSLWSHCNRPGDAQKTVEVVSRANKVTLKVTVHKGAGSQSLGMSLGYRAQPIEEMVGACGFGWVALRQFCVSAMEGARLPWAQAEMECARKGGHLVSIRNEHAQALIDNLLLNSPGYKENNAYWIGASDRSHEGDFHWSDGLPFSFTNWFPGWSEHSDYNRQPNDDGLSEQDCVEVRRVYALPSSSGSLAAGYMWNDRDCSTPNYFICERLQNDEPLEEIWAPDCNRTVVLSRQQPRAAVSSPGFPRQYPDNADCDTEIIAPPGYRLVLDFEELVIENEPSCSYDYLEIMEIMQNHANSNGSSNHSVGVAIATVGESDHKVGETSSRRLCGDWSAKLKLLRHVSRGSRLKLRFSSDYSHHYGGFKARVSMESAMRLSQRAALQCSDDRWQVFNHSCYLFVPFPEVNWPTAQQICRGKNIRAQLASVLSPEEERFITTNIRKMSEYRTSGRYWLGANAIENDGTYSWSDGSRMNYMGWLPGENRHEADARCLSMQWTLSPTPMLPSGLYWKGQKCDQVGGYVCKRATLISGQGINFNKTVNGSEGKLVTPNYPGNYHNNLDFTVRIVGPERTRIVIHFEKLDLESQIECLYDYVELKSLNRNGKHQTGQNEAAVKWCGNHETDMNRFTFVSDGNEVQLRFHSDYSITYGGFALSWHSVDISSCPVRTLTAKEGVVESPNYPNFLLARLNCTYTITAPPGRRVWLNFEDVDVDSPDYDDETRLYLNLGEHVQTFRPFQTDELVTDGSFVSNGNSLKIRLVTKNHPNGKGFRATYKTLTVIEVEKVIQLSNVTAGILLNLNYPDNAPHNADVTEHFIAPFGYQISLELFHLKLSENNCNNRGMIEVHDNYADVNGTSWYLCYDEDQNDEEDAIIPKAPIALTSFLNTLHLRQKHGMLGIPLNGTLRVHPDLTHMEKIIKHNSEYVESCRPNPCMHDGKCVHNGTQKICQCLKHFTGIFCALTHCDLEPCVFGKCELTETSFKCHCKNGYVGPTCEQKKKPCEGNPCEGRGICLEKGENFRCRCHAWWEGTRCERRMLHIPYKPLSERMLREPFWLGLMTVFVVMGVIGLVWCAKRHFPEKIEKLLAEEEDRNRGGVSSLRTASVREQLAASGAAAVTVTPSPGPGAPRSLFGRLGIRKPSILSLTSPHASGYSPATARTFSLDDLLKPPIRRTPSPKKKRNNSTPTKKNAAEKKQILQQLISPGGKQHAGKVTLGELMQMTEHSGGSCGIGEVNGGRSANRNRLHPNAAVSSDDEQQTFVTKETKFGSPSNPASTAQMTLTDPKLEKKVTFARLLSKVSAEMNSGGSSDLELDLAMSSQANRPRLQQRQKPSSADSILAMFRNFSSSSAGVNLPISLMVSPSTTPTASSPQDDVAGDDDSSTSSVYTPMSISLATPDSPASVHQPPTTIELCVIDAMSAHKSSTSGSNFLHPPTILLELPSTINKCLSPIRELPTPLPSPMPSPAVTPMMRRSIRVQEEYPLSDEENEIAEIPIDPQAEDGLIFEEAAVMHQNAASCGNRPKQKNRPPLLGQAHLLIPSINVTANSSPETSPTKPLIIPMLTIETPSPTLHNAPRFILPGSPPPRLGVNSFQFPTLEKSSNTTTMRKTLKDFDKPTSLDLPFVPPMITITCNMSEAESDAESISPNMKNTASSSGMSYLSPFSMVSRGEHTTSESNLSSSGYSSMASPGPSRCGSSNPLCPSEMEDPGPLGPGSHPPLGRRHSPLLRTPNISKSSNIQPEQRGRSDSETLSDDILVESNDEGIGTDHLDEKIEDGELKSAKELEVFITGEPAMNFLQPPSIVVHADATNMDKLLSPVSSRSESPLSDRSGVGRFSSQFYGRNKEFLPFTDSDGLYDFSSSDKVNTTGIQSHRKTGRKRDKKLIRQKSPSPTKSPTCYHLELPFKTPRKPSPKRRMSRNTVVSSSSSSDSVASTRDITKSSSSPSPDTIRCWAANLEWPDPIRRASEASAEETADETNNSMQSKHDAPAVQKTSKISRLRAISHQIRFLRRLELSLKRRERTISPSESLDSGDAEDSPRATSPLLHSLQARKPEMCKSQSVGKMSSSTTTPLLVASKNRRGKIKRGETLLLPDNETSWKRVVITGSGGHSD